MVRSALRGQPTLGARPVDEGEEYEVRGSCPIADVLYRTGGADLAPATFCSADRGEEASIVRGAPTGMSMSRCMSTPAIQDCLCISVRHGWSWMDGWTVRSYMVLQCRRGVSLLPAAARIAGGPVRSSASPTHCVCSGEECFAGSYCTRHGPSGSGFVCIYGTAWTSKGMMYCVLTLPGKAAHGAWPGHGCSAIPRRIRSSNSTRPPTALRGRYRRRVPVMDARPHILYAVSSFNSMPPIPRRTIRPHRPSPMHQPATALPPGGCQPARRPEGPVPRAAP